MPSIIEANRGINDAWQDYLKARRRHFAILDDSDDDNADIMQAEEKHAVLESGVRIHCRKPKNILLRLLRHIPQNVDDKEIQNRNNLKKRLKGYTEMYTRTSGRRELSAQNSELCSYAFNISHLSDSIASTVITDPNPSRFRWKLQFRQLSPPNSNAESIWSHLEYSESKFQTWWSRNRASESSEGSEAWNDMKRLSRRVVIRILETVEEQELQKFKHIRHLEQIAEMCRETVLYQLIFCFSLKVNARETFQEVVEYTIPIIYLVSEVTSCVSGSMKKTFGTAKNFKLETDLQMLRPYVTEIRDRSYRFGQSIGFNVHEYWSDFMAGAIPVTSMSCTPFYYTVSFMTVHPAAAKKHEGESTATTHVDKLSSATEENANLIGQGIQRMFPNDIPLNRDFALETESAHPSGTMSTLDAKVLLDIGLQEFTDIIYDTRDWKGGGAYADVFAMKRSGEFGRVAVKKCKPGPRSAKRVEREARNWIGLRHKHIASLLGFVCFDVSLSVQPCLVSELYHTDLKQLITKNGRHGKSPFERSNLLTEERRLKFLRDVSYALEFMHASNVVHGDLRAANVLVTNELLNDPSCYAVLNDFGMAEFYDDDMDEVLRLSSINMKTNMAWLAPELCALAPRQNSLARVSKEGDVYAFGAVFLEVVYERNPYHDVINVEHAKLSGESPARKEDLDIQDDLHWSLMEACWERIEGRPSALEIGKQLLDIIFKVAPENPTRHTI